MKRALVISGGGSKGAFAVGVVKKLLHTWPGLQFDILIGTSTGSLITPFVALDEMALVEELYTTQTTDKILTTYNLGDRLTTHSIFGSVPLWELLTQYIPESKAKQLLDHPAYLGFTTVCLQTGQLEVFANRDVSPSPKHYVHSRLQSPLHLQKAVLASASQPVFMPPVMVNKDIEGAGNEMYQYVDGGVRQYAGIEMAIDAGATEIFTVLLSSGKDDPVNKPFTDLFSILQQTIAIFTDDVGKNDLIIPQQYNEALSYIDAVQRKMKRQGVSAAAIADYFHIRGRESPYEEKVPIRLFTIRPDNPLGGGPGGLVFEPAEMTGMLAAGEKAAGNFIASLPPGDISWA
jgi:NTE family protein